MFQTILQQHCCSNVFTIFGEVQRFAADGGSDGVLRGFGDWLEEDPRGRFCMLNRTNYTRNGHDWNPMPDMELESWGVLIFGRAVSEKGGSDEPPEPPPGYGPAMETNYKSSRTSELPVDRPHPLHKGTKPEEEQEITLDIVTEFETNNMEAFEQTGPTSFHRTLHNCLSTALFHNQIKVNNTKIDDTELIFGRAMALQAAMHSMKLQPKETDGTITCPPTSINI